MTRRLFTVLVCTSLLLGLATPVAADEPVDPAGQPVESSAEDDAEVGVLADVPTGVHDKFEVGDVFVAVSGGKVQWRLPDGTLNKILDTGAGGFTTGMAFRRADKHLFVTSFGTSQVFEFDINGDLVGPFGSGFNSAPESIVFDGQDNMYVGQADGSADVLKFAPTGGAPIASFDVETEDRGSDWIELDSDQCTLRYTSEGTRVLQYDVCDDVQLNDYAGGLPRPAFALRNLPTADVNPDVLVASSSSIIKLHFGVPAGAYDASGQNCWFALNLDPDTETFWSADFCTSNVYRFNIDSGEVVSSFNTGTATSTVFGITVFGEFGLSTIPDCTRGSSDVGELEPDGAAGERITVDYDRRLVTEEMARRVKERAEATLDYYGDVGLPGDIAGLSMPTPGALRISIRCELDFAGFGVDPGATGFTGSGDLVQLRADEIRNELGLAEIEDYPAGGDWDNAGASWKNLIDHELIHVVQWQVTSLILKHQGNDHTVVESPAVLGQDLVPDADDVDTEYLAWARRFAQEQPTVAIEGRGLENAAGELSEPEYQSGTVLQYWAERFGPAGEPRLEHRAARFLEALMVAPGDQTQMYAEVVGQNLSVALRDYYLAHYALRAPNVSATSNNRFAILDAETGHGDPAGTGGAGLPAYPTLRTAPVDASDGDATDVGSVAGWAGNVYEVDLPPAAVSATVRLATSSAGATLAAALVPATAGDHLTIHPDRLVSGITADQPLVKVVPLNDQPTLVVAVGVSGFVDGGADVTLDIDVRTAPPAIDVLYPTAGQPHRLKTTRSGPIIVRFVPQGEPLGALDKTSVQLEVGGLNATVRGVPFIDGAYELSATAPLSLPAGPHDMALRMGGQDYAVPGGLVIDQATPPRMEQIISGTFPDLSQGASAATTATVSSGASAATFRLDWAGSRFGLQLTAPSGRVIEQTNTDPDVAVVETATSVEITVATPESGIWQMAASGTDVPAPEDVDYLVTESDTPAAGQFGLSDGGSAGLPFEVVVALSDEAGGIADADVEAVVTDPAGTVRRFPLADDGSSGDAGASDGTYGATLWGTDLAGTYHVRLTASGDGSAGRVQRTASFAVTLAAKVDTDGDGVADGAEARLGLDPADGSDGGRDVDFDGLDYAAELAAGLDPYSWDTDGGGERDASEPAAGLEPRIAADDRPAGAPNLGTTAIDGRRVSIRVADEGGDGSIRLFRIEGEQLVDLGTHPSGAAAIEDGPLAAGEYRYLAFAQQASGAESAPTIQGPIMVADDVTRPQFRMTLNGGDPTTTETTVSVAFTDLTEPVVEMRLALSEEALSGTAWQPYAGFSTVDIPGTPGQHFVYAQLRDAAGNESPTERSFVVLVDATPPQSTAGPLAAEYTTTTADVPYTASDDSSGVASVELWWRHRAGEAGTWSDWTLGPTGTSSPITFAFSNGDGFYEFYSVAIDNAGNREAPPATADTATQAVSMVSAPATERVSVSSAGAQGNAASGGSKPSAISDDGRFVAFVSDASNLVAGDTNGVTDVFVHDRQSGATTRVSAASDGSQANALSANPAISGDGRYVSFASSASNLATGDSNGQADVFVHDRQTGATTRVSVASGGAQANGASGSSSLSDDGRYLAFGSTANNLVGGDTNKKEDVFVHDRQTGATTRVSVTSAGAQAGGASADPAISDDGRYVAFASDAKDLVANDGNRKADIFVHDRQTGATTRVSLQSSGQEANAGSEQPAISGDGRYVAFVSFGTNLVPNDTNQAGDVFVHDRQTAETTRVSVTPDGGNPDDRAFNPSISDDGRYVGFASKATNLVAGSPSNLYDAYVRDRQEAVTLRVSIADDGSRGNSHSGQGSIEVSGNGRHVVFDSVGSNLVPGDTNGVSDVFVRADFGGG